MYIVIVDNYITCATTSNKEKAKDYVRRLQEQGIHATYIKLEEE